MTQTVIIFAAGVFLLVQNPFLSAEGAFNKLFLKAPLLLFGVALMSIGYARYMGWPV
jgi:uncharacterized membrane protein